MRIPAYSRNVLHTGLVGPFVMALAVLLGADRPMADNASVAKAQVQENYGKLPLRFEANRGQTDSRVKFLNRGKGYTLFLSPSEAVLALRGREHVIRMRFQGANPDAKITGLEKLPGIVNYFIGQDRKKWRTNIPAYARVKHKDVYPGIDIAYYGNQRQLEFDFIVAPGANPNVIKLAVEGADRLDVDAQGDLVLHVGDGQLRLQKPLVYQAMKGIRQEVSGSYVLTSPNQVRFQVADIFVTKLDPTGSGLVYSTYLGGSGFDAGLGIAVDAAGNAYVTGGTFSTDFPTTLGAFQTTSSGGNDAFVTKLNPTGSALLYSTYLRGAFGESIAVDAAGNAYVAGIARPTDFPTTLGAFQTASGGGGDAFVTKLNLTGSALVYSTYLGGSDFDVARGIAIDAAGNAYVSGFTASTNFPTTLGAFQTTYGGGALDAFVAKVDPTGSVLVYSTYLGGSDIDGSVGIAVDAAGNAYVTGGTSSTNFPTTPGAFQTAGGGAFVTKVSPTGTGLAYSTRLGGVSGGDGGQGVAVDAAGNAYVTGGTDSTDFPTTANAFQPAYGGGPEDAFVAKLNPTGSALIYSTYLGGSGDDIGFGIALDTLPNPNAYVTGSTSSANFATTPGAFQAVFGGGPEDAFVAKIAEGAVAHGPFTARVTGGGTIDIAGGIGTFSFIIQRAATGELSGRLQYINHASGNQVQSQTYTSLVIVANAATFDGTCTVNGVPCTFTVNVTDNGEPGTTDTFTISVSGGPTEGGILRSGNILINQ